MEPPKPQSLTSDLFDLDCAWRQGIADYGSRFRLTANPYNKYDPQSKLRAWAWDLGWRLADWVIQGKGKAA